MKTNKHGIIYNISLNIYRFRHCFRAIGKEFDSLSMFKLNFFNLIDRKQKIIFLKRLNLFVKPNFFVITTLIEIFNRKLYKNLKGLECVLDLGAYIGESSIYLVRHNKKVVAFEPSKEKFKLLKKNISGHKNIEGFNFAVVADKKIKEIVFYERDPFDFCSSNNYEEKLDKKVTVQCKDIISILNEHNFDGIKMDIEGGEFPIIEKLLAKNKFVFEKGIIEFHFTGEDIDDKVKIFTDFHAYLEENNFIVKLFDNYNKKIEFKLFDKTMSCVNLEFERK